MLISVDWLSDFVTLPSERSIKDMVHALTLHTVEVEGHWPAAGAIGDRHIVGRVLDASEPGAVTIDVGSRSVRASCPIALSAGTTTIVSIEGDAATVCTPADLGVGPMYPGSADQPIDLAEAGPLALGSSAAAALHLTGMVIEIDNKSLTNRPDLWGHLGIAREFAAIYGRQVTDPPLTEPDPSSYDSSLIDGVDASVCRRFTIATIDVPDGAQRTTPLVIRSRLHQVGQRSLGLYADLTNYAMFAVGQPSHAYDRATLQLPMSVHRGPAGSLGTLAGFSVEVTPTTCVIADAGRSVAIGGVVGGTGSQVTADTTSLVLEVANFDPVEIRRSSLGLGLRTDASARFEKNLDTQGVDRGRGYLLSLIAEHDPTAVITGHADVQHAVTTSEAITTSLPFLADRIGTEITAAEVKQRLAPLGFDVAENGDVLAVTVPTWRSTGDISIEHDILEEVARMIGYDALPPTRPTVELRPPRTDPILRTRRLIREFLAFRAHAQEILTYPWSIDALLRQAGFDPADGVRFEGAPATDRATLRPSLVPNLIGAVEANAPDRDRFRIFEIGTVYAPNPAGGIPLLGQRVAAAFVGDDLSQEFRAAVGAIDGLGRAARIEGLTTADADELGWGDPVAVRAIIADGQTIGRVAALEIGLGRRSHIAVFSEFSLDELQVQGSRTNRFESFSAQPRASVDLSVLVPDQVRWSDLRAAVDSVPTTHLRALWPIDEYRGPSLAPESRSLTVRLDLAAEDRTLDSADKAAARLAVANLLASVPGVQIRE